MAPRVNRGEIWLYTFGSPDKRRPVLVLSRQKAISLLRTVLVAPITSSAHGAPSEVQVGIEEGQSTIRWSTWTKFRPWTRGGSNHFVGTVGPAKMAAVCRALMIATGCGD